VIVVFEIRSDTRLSHDRGAVALTSRLTEAVAIALRARTIVRTFFTPIASPV
jgi:hypothetical protein